jgi:hypothetical protein
MDDPETQDKIYKIMYPEEARPAIGDCHFMTFYSKKDADLFLKEQQGFLPEGSYVQEMDHHEDWQYDGEKDYGGRRNETESDWGRWEGWERG